MWGVSGDGGASARGVRGGGGGAEDRTALNRVAVTRGSMLL